MAKIKVVHGAPCSGKTTFVREHAGANDLVWDYDSIRQALTLAGDHSRGTDAQNNMVLNLRQAYALSAADSEAETAWFICTRPSRAIEEALGEAEYIHMDATKEECLARLEADDTRPDKEFMQGLIEDYFEEARGMPSNEREYRNMEMRILPTEEGQEPSFFVEGHASTFEPYVLMTRDGVDYSERIEPHAFDGADLSDVVFRVDHHTCTGSVQARLQAQWPLPCGRRLR